MRAALSYWWMIVRSAWQRMSGLMGGVPHWLILLVLVALAIVPVATKIRRLPQGVSWTAAADPGTFIGPAVISILLLLILLASEPPRLHAQQEAEIARLCGAAKPQLLIRHVPDCPQCDGPFHAGMPTFRVEVGNTGLQSTRAVHLVVETISPLPAIDRGAEAILRNKTRVVDVDLEEYLHSVRLTSPIEFPIELAAWDALNPGEPPVHVDLMHWDLDLNQFVIERIVGPPPARVVAAAYTITLVAHALDTPPARTQFVAEPALPEWRLRQVE